MKRNLQNKLLLPSLTTLLVLMVGSAFLLAHIVMSRLKEHNLDMLRASNALLVKNVHNTTTGYLASINALSTTPAFRLMSDFLSGAAPQAGMTQEKALALVQVLLKRLAVNLPAFTSLNFADAGGNILASSDPQAVGAFNVKERAYFKAAMQGRRNISAPLISKSIHEKAVMVAVPLACASGRICGVIYGVLPCRWLLADTIGGVTMARTGYAYLVDGGSGLMLAHHVFDKVQTMDMFHYQPWMRQLRIGESGTKTDYRDSNGNPRLAVYSKEPVSGWIAVSCLATEELEEQAGFIRNVILGLMVGSALVVAAILVGIIRALVRDIQATNSFAQAVAAGDLNKRLRLRRDDEIGALGDALRAMVRALKRMIWRAAEQNRYFQEATRHMYADIYEIDVTGDRFAPENRLRQFTQIDAGELSYSESLSLLARRVVKQDFQETFLNTFSRDNILRTYAEGNVHLSLDCPVRGDAGFQWLRYDAYIFSVESDNAVHAYLYARNIDAEVENEIKARTDALTGCLSRGALEQSVAAELAANPGRPYAFFLIDIDNFKKANDTFGHAFGDHCLREFVAGIRGNFRRRDIIGRIGGDEFVVFIPSPGEEWVRQKAVGLVRTLDMDCRQEGNSLRVSSSVGIALAPDDGDTYAALYHNADAAMYAAKAAGKNGFRFFDAATCPHEKGPGLADAAAQDSNAP